MLVWTLPFTLLAATAACKERVCQLANVRLLERFPTLKKLGEEWAPILFKLLVIAALSLKVERFERVHVVVKCLVAIQDEGEDG